MKKLIVLLIFSLSFGWFVFAQNNNDETEKASPMQNAELIRKVCFLDIEGEVYTDVVVAIKSISLSICFFRWTNSDWKAQIQSTCNLFR